MHLRSEKPFVQKIQDCNQAMDENGVNEENAIYNHRQVDAAGFFILIFVHYANVRSYLHKGYQGFGFHHFRNILRVKQKL